MENIFERVITVYVSLQWAATVMIGASIFGAGVVQAAKQKGLQRQKVQ